MLTKSNRVKEFYQKIEGGNAAAFYLGTDGELVDMFSGLDLEEQLKISGPSRVIVEEGPNSFTVFEYYSSYGEDATIYYTVVTQVNESSESWITNTSSSLIFASQVTGLTTETDGTASAENSHFVTISLYKGQYNPNGSDTPIHQRFIDFEQDIREV